MATKERNIKILDHKIIECERLIDGYIEEGISDRKIEKQQKILNKIIKDRDKILSKVYK